MFFWNARDQFLNFEYTSFFSSLILKYPLLDFDLNLCRTRLCFRLYHAIANTVTDVIYLISDDIVVIILNIFLSVLLGNLKKYCLLLAFLGVIE